MTIQGIQEVSGKKIPIVGNIVGNIVENILERLLGFIKGKEDTFIKIETDNELPFDIFQPKPYFPWSNQRSGKRRLKKFMKRIKSIYLLNRQYKLTQRFQQWIQNNQGNDLGDQNDENDYSGLINSIIKEVELLKNNHDEIDE